MLLKLSTLVILIFNQTILDDPYSISRLRIWGFKKPFRLDRDSKDSGILVHGRSEIPSKLKKSHIS